MDQIPNLSEQIAAQLQQDQQESTAKRKARNKRYEEKHPEKRKELNKKSNMSAKQRKASNTQVMDLFEAITKQVATSNNMLEQSTGAVLMQGQNIAAHNKNLESQGDNIADFNKILVTQVKAVENMGGETQELFAGFQQFAAKLKPIPGQDLVDYDQGGIHTPIKASDDAPEIMPTPHRKKMRLESVKCTLYSGESSRALDTVAEDGDGEVQVAAEIEKEDNGHETKIRIKIIMMEKNSNPKFFQLEFTAKGNIQGLAQLFGLSVVLEKGKPRVAARIVKIQPRFWGEPKIELHKEGLPAIDCPDGMKFIAIQASPPYLLGVSDAKGSYNCAWEFCEDGNFSAPLMLAKDARHAITIRGNTILGFDFDATLPTHHGIVRKT
ncbi:MAG: hypothetical protein SGARI_005831, partial [Bacillariaceae sp.]